MSGMAQKPFLNSTIWGRMIDMPKINLGTHKVRKCNDCGERVECVWNICPYDSDVHGDDDPSHAIWLCDDCNANRIMEI